MPAPCFKSLMNDMPLVAILRGITPHEVLEHVELLVTLGLRIIEVPLNSPQAYDSIGLLVDKYGQQALIGAGTVTEQAQLDCLVDCGARLMVSPNTDPHLITSAKAAGLYVMPGCGTVSEGFSAIQAGADALKLFPAQALASQAMLAAMKTVMPNDVRICPVGGIRADNMVDYLNSGADGFGLGAALYQAGQTSQQTFINGQAFVKAWQDYQHASIKVK